jgi:hypothetical protein
MNDSSNTLDEHIVLNKIYVVRGQKVLLDRGVARLYDVSTGNLNKAVKRNLQRFPEDFMFQLNGQEVVGLVFQNGISKRRGGPRFFPYAFTEQGVAMLSTVLNSERAIAVNIQIMRLFTRLRQMLFDNTELRLAIEEIRKKTENNSKNIELVFQYLDELLDKKKSKIPPSQIGYKIFNR